MVSKLLSIKNAEHYIWGENCDGWHLLKQENLSVIEEKMPPHTSEQTHYHKRSEQLFYILEGFATMVVEEDNIILQKGESLYIPKETIHQLKNESEYELKFLVISAPKSHGDRVIV